MIARTWSHAVSVRVTAVYAVALLAVSLTLTRLGPHARELVVSQMSTNLHNLAHGHLGTLVGSAFVDGGDHIFYWLPGLVCLLALGELIWRGRGLVLAFAVGHIGATLIVAVGLVVAVETGWLPFSIARASDVGISYGAVCVLGALTASIPTRWRAAWVGGWVGVAGVATLGGDFTAVGHVLALLLGIGLSFRLRTIASWTPAHAALLTAGAAFGYFVLAGWSTSGPIAGGVGMLIAFFTGRALRSAGILAPVGG
ncbi:hypothetical protein H7K15_22470 [Mycobacterium parmense]|nr:hypothetical protein [Mycobacterium parmense]ORW55498.1 hypothetical protein AWC20_18155 [Mycobacterium parmense]